MCILACRMPRAGKLRLLPPKETFVSSDNTFVVLLANDDEDDRMMTAEAMQGSKLANDFRTVGGGPRKDGREALREMKAEASPRSIPVVILTTSRTETDIEKTYGLGANSFIVKAVTFEGLVQAMKVVTEYWLQIVQLPNGAQ
jgi:DNA-binding NarL/FixJ family response regulator